MAKKSAGAPKASSPDKPSAPSKNRVEFLTNRYGEDRVGTNLEEAELSPSNVSVQAFGKLFTRPVDGDLYAQPLLVNDLTIDGRKHASVVFLATSRNTVYAYDAEDPNESLPLWETNVGALFNPPRLPVPRDAIFQGYTNFNAEVGITSTPVIDRDRKGGVLYVAAKTVSRPSKKPWAEKDFAYHIHAIDILTGKPAESVNGGQPMEIKARAVSPKQRPAKDPERVFSPRMTLNRPGLLLLNGVLYLAFGSQGDIDPYAGWIIAYDAKTLEKLAVHCPAIEWGQGGIWQSGNGLAGETTRATDGSTHHYVYTVVANGEKPVRGDDDQPKVINSMLKEDPPGQFHEPTIAEPVYGNAILKLELLRGDADLVGGRPPTQGEPKTPFRFDVIDWFTVTDCLDLNENDNDLISGPVLFEARSKEGASLPMVLGGGKDGKFYLCDRNNLGKFVGASGDDRGHVIIKNGTYGWQPRPAGAKITNTNIYQDDKLCEFHIHGTPAIWRRGDDKITAFVWSENDNLKAYEFDPQDLKFGGPQPRGVTDPPRTTQSTSQYRLPANELRMPGGFIAVSSNGATPGTGIVWAAHTTDDDAMNKTVKGTLRAFDAEDLNDQLWTSDDEPQGTDRLGMLAKFVPPVVANGKVYMSTFSRELVVYGMLAPEASKRRQESRCGIFQAQAYGSPAKGSCTFTCGRYELKGSGLGLDPGSMQDGFFLAYDPINADQAGVSIEITAQIHGLTAPPTMANACAGLMIRLQGGRPGADDTKMPYAAVLATPRAGALFLCRDELAAETHEDSHSSTMVPSWMRLTAISSATEPGSLEFTGSVSPDGKAWQVISSRAVVPMSGMVWVGLVATGKSASPANQGVEQVTASFGSVTVSPRSP